MSPPSLDESVDSTALLHKWMQLFLYAINIHGLSRGTDLGLGCCAGDVDLDADLLVIMKVSTLDEWAESSALPQQQKRWLHRLFHFLTSSLLKMVLQKQ